MYTLNSDKEFTGGRLCYYTEETGLFIPSRPAGTLSVHRREMHAVTKLLTGVRYVFFVVDDTNDLGRMRGANIVEIDKQMVSKMKNSAKMLEPGVKRKNDGSLGVV